MRREKHYEEAVARHVDAIQSLLGVTVVALICDADEHGIHLVTPEAYGGPLLEILRTIDWETAR